MKALLRSLLSALIAAVLLTALAARQSVNWMVGRADPSGNPDERATLSTTDWVESFEASHDARSVRRNPLFPHSLRSSHNIHRNGLHRYLSRAAPAWFVML
jgi:hypothetical protein